MDVHERCGDKEREPADCQLECACSGCLCVALPHAVLEAMKSAPSLACPTDGFPDRSTPTTPLAASSAASATVSAASAAPCRRSMLNSRRTCRPGEQMSGRGEPGIGEERRFGFNRTRAGVHMPWHDTHSLTLMPPLLNPVCTRAFALPAPNPPTHQLNAGSSHPRWQVWQHKSHPPPQAQHPCSCAWSCRARGAPAHARKSEELAGGAVQQQLQVAACRTFTHKAAAATHLGGGAQFDVHAAIGQKVFKRLSRDPFWAQSDRVHA